MVIQLENPLKILSLALFVSAIIPISSALGPIPDTKEIYPTWSPDGQKILFISYGPMSQGIFIVKPDGSQLQKITSEGWNPSWHPDGTSIVIQKNFFNGTDIRNGSYEIALLDIKTLNVTRLTYHGNSDAESRPKYSPDGEKIIFRWSNGIYVMNSGGTELKKLVDNASSPEWSHDGKKIAYYTYDDVNEIWIIRPDGAYKRKVFIDYKHSIYDRYRWTPDSRYLLLNNGSNIITKVNIENTSDVEYVYEPVAHLNPKYSPDGNYITFISNMDGGDLDLFVARSDGSEVYNLVFDTNPRLQNATPDYFNKKSRPTPPSWPTPEPTAISTITETPTVAPTETPIATATQTPEVPGFSFLLALASLLILVLIRKARR